MFIDFWADELPQVCLVGYTEGGQTSQYKRVFSGVGRQSLAVLPWGEARWDEMCLSLWQYFRAMADPSIRESQLSARPWMAVGGFQFGLEEIADLAK